MATARKMFLATLAEEMIRSIDRFDPIGKIGTEPDPLPALPPGDLLQLFASLTYDEAGDLLEKVNDVLLEREKGLDLVNKDNNKASSRALHGVPVVIKDSSVLPSCGVMMIGKQYGPDSDIVCGLLEAGAVIVGKASLTKVGMHSTFNPLKGYASLCSQPIVQHSTADAAIVRELMEAEDMEFFKPTINYSHAFENLSYEKGNSGDAFGWIGGGETFRFRSQYGEELDEELRVYGKKSTIDWEEHKAMLSKMSGGHLNATPTFLDYTRAANSMYTFGYGIDAEGAEVPNLWAFEDTIHADYMSTWTDYMSTWTDWATEPFVDKLRIITSVALPDDFMSTWIDWATEPFVDKLRIITSVAIGVVKQFGLTDPGSFLDKHYKFNAVTKGISDKFGLAHPGAKGSGTKMPIHNTHAKIALEGFPTLVV